MQEHSISKKQQIINTKGGKTAHNKYLKSKEAYIYHALKSLDLIKETED